MINASADCQRLALINFIQNHADRKKVCRSSIRSETMRSSARLILISTARNQLAISYNFDYSKNTNQTFDVATYGNFSERHRRSVEDQRLTSICSRRFADEAKRSPLLLHARVAAALGGHFKRSGRHGDGASLRTFRFGNPFFLEPNVDELLWRTQVKDNFSIISGNSHRQVWRRVDAHAERSGVPWLLHRPVYLRQRYWLSALRIAGRWAGFGRTSGCRTALIDQRPDHARRQHARCCCSCRARDRMDQPPMLPGHPTSRMKTTRCLRRTSGRSDQTSL